MIRATEVLPAGSWSDAAADSVTLDAEGRHRRRVVMKGEGGLAFLLDLPQPAALRDRDGLQLEDGRIVLVRAAPEKLAEISASSPNALARIAWHLGNRHFPAQIVGERIRIRRDHVIEALMLRLGANVEHLEAPFEPEGGAYGHHHDG
jgi:urease accessory protein